MLYPLSVPWDELRGRVNCEILLQDTLATAIRLLLQ